MLVSKRQQVINLVQELNVKKAISLLAKFKREFNKEQLRKLQIANECLKPGLQLNQPRIDFYKSIGVDVFSCTRFAINTARTYGN